MAKWRALHGDISTSGQVNRLTEFEQLLFTWMIPHADDWGVLTGDLMELKLKVMPGTDRQSQEVDAALNHIEEVGLIWRYEPDGEGPLIQFRKWDGHQPIRKDRRLSPENTPYLDFCQLPANAGQSREKTGYTILDHTIPDKTRPEVEPPPFSSIFTEITGVLVATGTQAQEIDAWMEDVPEEWFRQACKAAVDNNARKWAYVRKICQRCRDEGKAPGEGKHGKSSQGPQLTPEQEEMYRDTFVTGEGNRAKSS